MEKTEMLERLNSFTRREMTEDEVYIFDIILCDNEIDRDGERFSLNALKTLEKLFVGKTGIFDHDPKSAGQTARIFATELVTDSENIISTGEYYTYLKATAYMIRTESNSDLIREIDGGIKKEVSVSCSSGKRICSICGTELNKKSCPHVIGREYNGKIAHVILDDIKDAYEWSFVAVPAQVNAGVTKKFFGKNESTQNDLLVEKLCASIKADIYRLCLASGSSVYTKALAAAADKMTADELLEFKSALEKEHKSKPISQIKCCDESFDAFRMEGKTK